MKTNSNKKSIFIIFLTSMLALMLSVVTLFTLPTFSAKADTEETLPAVKMVKVAETAPGKYYKAVYVGDETLGRTIQFTQADGLILLTDDTNGGLVIKDMGGGGVLKNTPGQAYDKRDNNYNTIEFYMPKVEEITFDYTTTSANTMERYYTGVVTLGECWALYELNIDTTNYVETDVLLNSNWESGQVLRLRKSDNSSFTETVLSATGIEGLKIDPNLQQVTFLTPNATNNGVVYIPALSIWGEGYIDVVVPENIDIPFRNYSDDLGPTVTYDFTMLEYQAPAGVPEEVPEDENEDFLQGIKDKVNNGANIASEWIEEHFGVTIAGSTLIIVAVAIAIILIVRRRRR